MGLCVFRHKTEELCTPLARIIQGYQDRYKISNIELAKRSKMSTRNLIRIKSGASCNTATLDRLLDCLGLELTAQPIGADYRDEMRKQNE